MSQSLMKPLVSNMSRPDSQQAFRNQVSSKKKTIPRKKNNCQDEAVKKSLRPQCLMQDAYYFKKREIYPFLTSETHSNLLLLHIIVPPGRMAPSFHHLSFPYSSVSPSTAFNYIKTMTAHTRISRGIQKCVIFEAKRCQDPQQKVRSHFRTTIAANKSVTHSSKL